MNELERVSATLIGDWEVVTGDGSVWPPEDHPYYDDVAALLAAGDVGTEWAAVVNQTGDDPLLLDGTSFRGAQYGISVNGFGPFGPDNLFDTSWNAYILDHPGSPDGANFGMASGLTEGGIAGEGTSDVPVVVGGSVQFVFNVTGELSTEDISNVNFQYGTTSATDPNITIAPEPSTMSLLGIGLAGFMALAKIRRKRA